VATLRPTGLVIYSSGQCELVAEPDFYRLAARLLGDSRHNGREVFLKSGHSGGVLA